MANIDVMIYKFKDETLFLISKIIGWVSLIIAVIRLILFFFGFNYFPISLLRNFSFAAPMFAKMEKDLISWNISLTLLEILLFCWIFLQVVSAALILVGVKYEKKHAFWPYIVQTILEFVGYILFFIFFMFSIVYVVSGGKQTTGKVKLEGQNVWLMPFLFTYIVVIDLIPFTIIFLVKTHLLISSRNKSPSSADL